MFRKGATTFKGNTLRRDSTAVGRTLGGPAGYGDFGVAARLTKLDQFANLSGKRLLDLGCGNGSYTVELALRAAWACGVDVQERHLVSFRKPIPRVRAVGEWLPFASGAFDAVTMIEVLEHVESDEAVLAECHRVLKTTGRLLLFVPNKLYPLESHPCFVGRKRIGKNIPFVSWLPSSIRMHLCHARIYSKARLLRLASRAGFAPEVTAYVYPPLDHFPIPFKGKYRTLARLLENTPLRVFGVSLFVAFRKN